MEYLLNSLSQYLDVASFLAFPVVFLAGILTSFTPCVYPVAPITIAYIGAHSAGSRGKGFRLSLCYVLGVSLTYTALGALAAVTGGLFGQIQANPWTNFVLANVFLVMGLSMMGLFSLTVRTPKFIAGMQFREQTKGLLGSLIMGAASGLVIGPCTAPVLAVLLSYVATRQNMILGMSLLFVFSLGMGTLLLVLGTGTGILSSLPKSGLWMVRINRLFGLLLLAMAEYYLVNAGMLWI